MESNNKPKLDISISKEHKEDLAEIEEIFSDFNIKADANLMRFSAEDLPMQIIIHFGSVIASGLTWDLIKLAIKKTYKKFSKARIIIRDKNSIMYAIKNDFTVVVIVVPDRKKEFEYIKNLDDLAKYMDSRNYKEL